MIIQQIRLPRLLVGLMVGASLGLAGAALQGLLRNPLADPGVIGVSASAGFGAVVALYYGAAALSPIAIPGFAMVAALTSTALLYLLARRDASVLTLLLIGIGLSSFAGALTSLANRSYTDIALALPFMILGWALLLMAAPGLRTLTLGEETAATMGLNLMRVRTMIISGAALSVGAAVAVSGSIGFIGLIVPHMMRPFTGHDPGRITGLIGPNGAGKTSLMRALLRLVPVSGGRILLDGTDITRMPPHRTAHAMAYLAQSQTVHWPLSVEALVSLGRMASGHLGPVSEADQARIDTAIEECGLTDLRERPVTHLSGGERARALLARLLASDAPILLVDEPVAALDAYHQLAILDLLKNGADQGKSVLIILHDLSLARRFCDRIWLMHQGSLVADGSAEEIIQPDHLNPVYGVDMVLGDLGAVVPLRSL